MGMGFGFALAGAAEGLGTGIIEAAARKREDALRAAEQEREDRIRAEERQWDLEDRDHRDSRDDLDYERRRGDTLEDEERSNARIDRANRRNADAVRGLLGRSQHETATNMVDYLVERGMDPIFAVGAVGNFIQESQLDPRHGEDNTGDGGLSGGYGQWHKDRLSALKDFAKEQGRDWREMETQLDYFLLETQTTEKGSYQAIVDANPQTAEDAAALWSQHFWRPGEPHIGNRRAYAADLWASYNFEDNAAEALGDTENGPPAAVATGLGKALGLDTDANDGFKDVWTTTGAPPGQEIQVRVYDDGRPSEKVPGPDGSDLTRPISRAREDDDDVEGDVEDKVKLVDGDISDFAGEIAFGADATKLATAMRREVRRLVTDGADPDAALQEVIALVEANLDESGEWNGRITDGAATADTADAGAATADVGGLPTVTTQEQYDALPPNSEYIDRDGNTRKKS